MSAEEVPVEQSGAVLELVLLAVLESEPHPARVNASAAAAQRAIVLHLFMCVSHAFTGVYDRVCCESPPASAALAIGDKVVVVFLAGANGDITQVNNLSPYVNPGREQWARLVGSRVGAEAVKVLASMHTGALGPVDFGLEVLAIPRRVPSPERLKRSVELVKQGPDKAGRTEWTFAKEIVMLDALIAKTPVVDAEVQAVQVGPAVFVSNPAEYFVEYGLDIKKRSKFPFTYPVELANGCVGYVPTEEALSPTGGGYETRLSSYSNLERTAGTQIADAGVRLANRLTPGQAPRRGPHAPFSGEGWSYGSVPAELQ